MKCNLKPITVEVSQNQYSDFGKGAETLHFGKSGIHHRLLSEIPFRGRITVDKTPASILDAALFIVKLRSRKDYDRIVDGADQKTDLVDCNEFYFDTLRSIDPIGDIARWEDKRIVRAVYSLADGLLTATSTSLTSDWSKFLDTEHWDLVIPPRDARKHLFDYTSVAAEDIQFSLLYDILSASVWRTLTMPLDADKKMAFHVLARNVKPETFKYSAIGLNLAVLSNEFDLGLVPFNFNDGNDTITQWCYHIEDLRIHPTDYEKVMEQIGVYFYCEAEDENGNG